LATLLWIEALPVKLPAADGAKRTLNEALEPAGTVTGEDIPETLKPEPVALTEDTVRLAVPVLLKVTVLEVLLPALMLPKETLVGEAEIAPCVASALNGMTSALADALLKIETLPVALPATVGAKTTLKVAELPAPTEIPPDTPETLNPVPDAVIDETDRVAEPVFDRVTVCVVLLPMATLPNAMLAGDAEMPDVTPEPVNATVIAESEALLLNAMLPLAAPAAVGENSAVKVAVPPAARVSGTGAPAMEKPTPVVMACETVVDAVPEFLRMIVALPVAPTLTLPKLTDEGVAASAPCTPIPDRLRVALGSDEPTVPETWTEPDDEPDAVGANVTVNFVLADGAKTIGRFKPVTSNSVPTCVMPETVMDSVPELVSVTVSLVLLPTATSPKVSVDGLVVNFAVLPPEPDVAVPISGRISGRLPASTKRTVPEKVPAEGGSNVTLKFLLAPAGIEVGTDKPLIPKPVPTTVAKFRDRGSVPSFVRVTGCDVKWPAWAFEKSMVFGEIESLPPDAPQPEPTKLIVSGSAEMSLTTTSSPVSTLESFGVKRTRTVALPPGAIDTGASPTSENAEPEILALEILAVVRPSFVSVTARIELEPCVTVPNFMLFGVATSFPA
jgi:hypothetical protein